MKIRLASTFRADNDTVALEVLGNDDHRDLVLSGRVRCHRERSGHEVQSDTSTLRPHAPLPDPCGVVNSGSTSPRHFYERYAVTASSTRSPSLPWSAPSPTGRGVFLGPPSSCVGGRIPLLLLTRQSRRPQPGHRRVHRLQRPSRSAAAHKVALPGAM